MNGILLSDATTGGLQLETLLGYGTDVLAWFISSFGTILTYFMSNPGLLIWFFIGLAGVAFVFFRKLF